MWQTILWQGKSCFAHENSLYRRERKKNVCNVCGYRFAKIKFLKNHLTTHGDVRRYACDICGARVKTRDTLKQHRKKLHNLLTPVAKNAQVEEPMRGEITPRFIKKKEISVQFVRERLYGNST